MSETAEHMAAIRDWRQSQGAERRSALWEEYDRARAMADQAGLILIRCSEVHYQMSSQRGRWLINIYPGNQRLAIDKNRRRPPFLRVGRAPWTITDVVEAAIEQGLGR